MAAPSPKATNKTSSRHGTMNVRLGIESRREMFLALDDELIYYSSLLFPAAREDLNQLNKRLC